MKLKYAQYHLKINCRLHEINLFHNKSLKNRYFCGIRTLKSKASTKVWFDSNGLKLNYGRCKAYSNHK